MSGIIGDNVYRASGVIAEAAGGVSWQAIETGSTMTAVAGNGYWIDTTSNACTITLPSSASNGDKIIFDDYARYWGTNSITLDSNGLNYQGQDDSYTVEYGTDGQTLHIIYSGATKGWIPILDKDVSDVPFKGNSEGIFGYGQTTYSMTNLVSNVGVVSADVTGVGTGRSEPMACEYGGDKGIFAYGYTSSYLSMSNLVSNTGVVGSDVSGVGTARNGGGACEYGGDKGIFAYGDTGTKVSMSNLVTNVGVVGSDVTGVGTARYTIAACEYGNGLGIFAYGESSSNGGTNYNAMSNLVTNVGVIGSDVTGVGTIRAYLAACGYGDDKGIFGHGFTGSPVSMTNLVTNVGVVGSDVTGVGSGRKYLTGCEYGYDKGIFGYGYISAVSSLTNLISNVGVAATDVTGVGTARRALSACSYN